MQIRLILLIVWLLALCLAHAQKGRKAIYNFQTDYYWDSTLYKSEMAFYYELKGVDIYESHYPVKVYDYSIIKKDSPLIQEHVYHVDNFRYKPYHYKRIKDSLAIVFWDYGEKKPATHVDYILRSGDSVAWMMEKNVLVGENRGEKSLSGKTKYLGTKKLIVGGRLVDVYCFEENHRLSGVDMLYYNITEVCIDTATLIPVQFVRRKYNRNGSYTNYFSITKINAVTSIVPRYGYEADLALYENKTVKWTQKQRDVFLNNTSLGENSKPYMRCLLSLLDGYVSFYNYERNPLFKQIAIHSKCDPLIPKQ